MEKKLSDGRVRATDDIRRQREIAKWERERARPKRRGYFAWLIFVICLIYMTDEVASQIGVLMKTDIANDLFMKFGESSVGMLEIVSMIVVPFQVCSIFYKPLADRFGRKLFLVINTFGMSFALLLIFLSNNLVVYFLGAALIQFFIPHDMHVVYIMEFAPQKHRARVYSCIKFVANIGVMIVPILRRLLMSSSSEWRKVFLIPALIGLLCSFIALICARETDAFINSRLKYLYMSKEEREEAQRKKKAESSQGGVREALKFAFSHKQIKWLYISSAFVNVGLLLILQYQVIMNYGYAEHLLNIGAYNALEDAVSAAGVGVVTDALFFFTIGSALAQVMMGFVCDRFGRKNAAIFTSSLCVITLLTFFFGSRWGLTPVIVGLAAGASVGSFYSTNDVLIMMIGESSPTNLRSSTISSQYFVTALGVIVSYAVGIPLLTVLGNSASGWIVLGLALPGFVAALTALCLKTKDTTGINMDTVTGSEWD